jgi:hypothetical protein
MKNKIFLVIFILILVLVVSIGIFYLNNVILPTKIKILVISGLKDITGKEVSLETLRFDIFKGLVLKNLLIYDDVETLFSLKEGSCRFFIIPLFKKQIIIPSIRFKSASMLLVRRKDNTFNIQDLSVRKISRAKKPKFNISIFRVTVTDASIHFRDDTFSLPFTKDIENLDFNLYLNLPANVKLNLKSQIPAPLPVQIKVTAKYELLEEFLTAKISLQNFVVKEFLPYYQNMGIDITEGSNDALIDLKSKDKILYIDFTLENKNLTISKEKLKAMVNSETKANLQYNLKDKQIDFSGKANIAKSQIQGLEFLDTVNNINGQLSFTKSNVSCDNLSADIWGIPITAKFNLTNFTNPLLNISIVSSLNMSFLQGILKERFKFAFPGQIEGQGKLSLGLETQIPFPGPLPIKGYLDILDTVVKLEKFTLPEREKRKTSSFLTGLASSIENINGRLEFTQEQLKWQDINFKYMGIPYKTEGLLTDFKTPKVQLVLTSQDAILKTNFAIYNRIVSFSRFTGKYLNSDFSLAGKVDTKDPSNLAMDIRGDSDINLEDLQKILKNFKNKLKQANPEGMVRMQFNLGGNLSDFKSLAIKAELSIQSLSIYGLKFSNLLMSYNQSEGIIDIPLTHSSLYDGTVQVGAKLNLNSANPPYFINADIQNIKIEKLKLDTKAKEKDISGTLKAQINLNGFLNDISKLKGTGKINISEGNLWQLNLFKGLGPLLFAKDFANIVFQEGSCAFLVQDQYIFTDNLRLKSNITELSGSVKIGFDSSIDASLNVQVLDEMVPLTGTFKDITTAIVGQAGRFGIIKISGTLNEPKYKFQPLVVDIIRGLKEAIFGE